MAKNEVIQLVRGTIERSDGLVLEAHSSATLILCGERRILVDTSTPERRQELVSAMEKRDLSPEEIDTVIYTHLHGDHTGNGELFTNATFLAHVDEIPPAGIEPLFGDEKICEGVNIIHTPGHTRGSISVLVEGDRRYVIAGDALPTRENYTKWVPPNLNYYPELALKSMGTIMEEADVIIPGHDDAFEVDR